MTVGLMMVVRNESHRIVECLDHHVKFFDEVVVCDQQSDDDTWQLAVKFLEKSNINSIIWQDVNHGHCAPSRQETLSKLSTDWVVMIDADEKFPIDFLKNMHQLAKKGNENKIDCYTLFRKNSFDVQVYDDTVVAYPKWLYVEHPVLEKQFRFFTNKNAIFSNNLHSRVHFHHEGNEKISPLEFIIDHRKTLSEMQADLARFREVNKKC